MCIQKYIYFVRFYLRFFFKVEGWGGGGGGGGGIPIHMFSKSSDVVVC